MRIATSITPFSQETFNLLLLNVVPYYSLSKYTQHFPNMRVTALFYVASVWYCVARQRKELMSVRMNEKTMMNDVSSASVAEIAVREA